VTDPTDPEARRGTSRSSAVATVVVVALLASVVALLAVVGARVGEPEAGPSGADTAGSASGSSSGSSAGSSAGSETASAEESASGKGDRSKGDRGGEDKDADKGRDGAGGTGGDSDLRDRVEDEIGEALEDEQTGFRVASFNVLGASHTGPRGNKPAWRHARTAPRVRTQVGLLDSEGVSVVGMQEFEPKQVRAFQRRTGGRWSEFPGLAGGRAGANSIAWRTDTWTAVETHTIGIPYFGGQRWPMPYVRLRHAQTGAEVWFVNVHNPASTPRWGNNARWRALATRLELALVRRLRADGPVVMTGDFNEKAVVLCRVLGSGLMQPAGGTGTCAPPRGSSVDWIFGTNEVEFSQVAWRRTAAVRSSSDHPLVVATAVVPAED